MTHWDNAALAWEAFDLFGLATEVMYKAGNHYLAVCRENVTRPSDFSMFFSALAARTGKKAFGTVVFVPCILVRGDQVSLITDFPSGSPRDNIRTLTAEISRIFTTRAPHIFYTAQRNYCLAFSTTADATKASSVLARMGVVGKGGQPKLIWTRVGVALSSREVEIVAELIRSFDRPEQRHLPCWPAILADAPELIPLFDPNALQLDSETHGAEDESRETAPLDISAPRWPVGDVSPPTIASASPRRMGAVPIPRPAAHSTGESPPPVSKVAPENTAKQHGNLHMRLVSTGTPQGAHDALSSRSAVRGIKPPSPNEPPTHENTAKPLEDLYVRRLLTAATEFPQPPVPEIAEVSKLALHYSRGSPAYKIIVSPELMNKLTAYNMQLINGAANPGLRFERAINARGSPARPDEFLETLLATKLPQIFAESEVTGDGSDWNQTEEGLLGDVVVAVSCTIFDSGSFENVRPHRVPFGGVLLFVPGPLLACHGPRKGIPADLAEICAKPGETFPAFGLITPRVTSTGLGSAPTLVRERYEALVERRIFPALRYANDHSLAHGKKAHVRTGGIGAGQFAGEFLGQMHEQFHRALLTILTNHEASLSNLAVIEVFFHNEVPRDSDSDGVFSRAVGGAKYRAGKLPGQQLDYPESGCILYKLVAWDSVSLPGNDYWSGDSRTTDDGVAAAATNLCQILTGVPGTWNPHGAQGKGGFTSTSGEMWGTVASRLNTTLAAKNNTLVVWSSGVRLLN